MRAATFTSCVVRTVPLAAFFAVSGCFATRNDVRVVQSDLASMRTELLKGQADQMQALTQATRSVAVASDSVRAMSNRLTSLQGDIKGGLYNVNQQLLSVQELLNQNTKKIQDYRAAVERANAQIAAPPMTPVGAMGLPDSSAMTATPQPTTSASVLYAEGMRNLNRNSTTTARSTFQELLATFPTSDLASQAQLGVGQSYQNEKKLPEALQAYDAVVTKYPDSPDAPRALYKSANINLTLGRKEEAKRMFQQVVSRYPGSDEFSLATEALKNIR